MRLRFAVLLLLAPSLWLVAGSHGMAAVPPAGGSNITVRPFLQEVKINPGGTSQQFQLTINNDSKFTQTFHLSAVNFGSLNETGGLVFQGANASSLSSKYGLSHWLSLDKPQFDLAAGQQTTVTVTITNDTDLAPGAHYAAIITSASRPDAKSGQLTITPKVSSLVFATKLGGDFYDIHLQSVSTNGSLWRLPSEANVRLKSTGNTYITPRGIVWLMQSGRQEYKGIINAQSALVLPETIRNFNVPLGKIASFKKGLFISSYSLRVDYRYDGNPNFATHSYSYKVINKTTVILIMAIAVLAIAAAKAARNIRSWK